MCKINGEENINIESLTGIESIKISDCNTQNCNILDIIMSIIPIKVTFPIKHLTIENNEYITKVPVIDGDYSLTINNCPNLLEIPNINNVAKLTIENCPKLNTLKYIKINKEFTIKNCNNLNIDHGYVGLDFIIENCNDLNISSNYNGSAYLVIENSNNITFPSNVWIEGMSIKNCKNIAFTN